MVIIAVHGIVWLFDLLKHYHRTKVAYMIQLIIGINFIYIGVQMVYYHPYQNSYFNNLISHKKNNIRHNFEMDYWGLSYFQALRYLAEVRHPNPTDTLNILVDTSPGAINIDLLKKEDINRIKRVFKIEDADYFLTNYRRRNKDITEFSEEVFKISVHNSSIMSVFKVDKKNNKIP